MKKYFFATTLTLIFSANVFCSRDFVEKTDYFVEFQEKSPKMAAVLHVNFTSDIPEPKEAEEIVKQQLKAHGNMLAANKKVAKYKNIIGSAWYVNKTYSANPVKIKFQKDLGAYVWLGKTKRIVTFPDYMSFLKRERNNKKIRDKAAKKKLQEQGTEN
jgi:hypothetical protein